MSKEMLSHVEYLLGEHRDLHWERVSVEGGLTELLHQLGFSELCYITITRTLQREQFLNVRIQAKCMNTLSLW